MKREKYNIYKVPVKFFLKKNRTFLFFMALVIFFSGTIFPQSAGRIKIVRVATVDIARLITIIKNNTNIEMTLRVRKSSELIRINELMEEIVEAELYLKDNKDLLTAVKIGEIEEEIFIKQREIAKLNASVGVKSAVVRKISSDAIRGLYQLIKKEAQTKGFSLVLEKSNSVIYVDEDLDLTSILEEKLLELGKKKR